MAGATIMFAPLATREDGVYMLPAIDPPPEKAENARLTVAAALVADALVVGIYEVT